MKLLVTGGCGFIGSNFILEQVIEKNNTVVNIDKLTYAGNTDNLEKINNNPNYKLVEGDICDNSLVIDTIKNFGPNAIIHFAAESHVDRSIEDPLKFVKTNILGTANILNASLSYFKSDQNQNFRFLHVSTDEVYGSISDNEFFTENSPYNPSSPYSASKASSDHLVRAWHYTYGLPILITNCTNNYGPHQFPEKLIPLIIANCIDEKPLPVYGEGLNVRDWLYVKDHCNALYNVLNKGKIGETYNIGGNNELKNIEIVKIICKTLDKLKPRKNNKHYSELISFVADRPGHDYRYAIDSTKTKNEIGWVPRETFTSGIKKTITWYIKNEAWWRKIQNENYSQERLGLTK